MRPVEYLPWRSGSRVSHRLRTRAQIPSWRRSIVRNNGGGVSTAEHSARFANGILRRNAALGMARSSFSDPEK